jgi:predicted nucleotidyltransferase
MENQQPSNHNLILPVGTQVVTRVTVKLVDGLERSCGALGVIIKALDQTHSYLVQFPDDTKVSLRREELSIHKQWQAKNWQTTTNSDQSYLYNYVIYRCIVGSKAYGLDDENSDTDRRGIYLPPAELHWSLSNIPEQLDNKATEECYWEIQKFLTLALKANPNVLECLFTPLIETLTPLAEELLAMRQLFLSKLVYQTYNGYVMSQFKKLEQDLRTKGVIKPKHAMHLIRLLLSGITVLREGIVTVRVDENKDKLLLIRHGEMPWQEVNSWRLSLHQEFEKAFNQTTLPERPDYQQVNNFLIKARRSMV